MNAKHDKKITKNKRNSPKEVKEIKQTTFGSDDVSKGASHSQSPSQDRLIQNKQGNTSTESDSYECQTCHKLFENLLEMKCHKILHRPRTIPWVMFVYDKAITGCLKAKLTQKARDHGPMGYLGPSCTGLPRPGYLHPCRACARIFVSLRSFKDHLVVVHNRLN